MGNQNNERTVLKATVKVDAETMRRWGKMASAVSEAFKEEGCSGFDIHGVASLLMAAVVATQKPASRRELREIVKAMADNIEAMYLAKDPLPE